MKTSKELATELLFELFGECEENWDEVGPLYHNGQVYGYFNAGPYFIAVETKEDKIRFGVDLRGSFNKESQMPIHFVVDIEKGLSTRRKKRIFEALNYLKRSSDAGTYIGSMPGFDDLAEWVRMNFYK